MQENSAEYPPKLARSNESALQPISPNAAHLPRALNNPRFAVTAETMGMNLRCDAEYNSSRIQQPQHTNPIVDVKSYYERHSKYPTGSFTNYRPESSDSLQSSQSNIPPTYALRGSSTSHCLTFNPNNKADFMAQSPSPINSPPTPQQQQWNFDRGTRNNESLQLNARVSADNYKKFPSLKSVEESSSKTDGQSLGKTSAAAAGAHAVSMSESRTQCDNFSLNDSAKLNFKTINGVYEKRIEEIDAMAWGDKDLKIFTYQEWVDVLVKINEAFLNNMEELEKEVTGRLELVQRRVNSSCRHSQGNELMKCRKDVDTLLKYIKNSSDNKKGDFLRDLTLETLTPDQVLYMLDFDNLTIEDNAADEAKNYQDTDVVQRNKLYANMKALAQEVAEKHDEVRELKRQVICLEDEIQKAQKKIQLKDDVIKELRNDLKCASNNKIPSNPPLETSPSVPPINFESQISCSANTQLTDNTSMSQGDNGSQYDSLGHAELEESEKIKILQDEISDYIEIGDSKLKEVIEKLELEKKDAYRKLEFIRQQLIDLECESSEGKSDCDSGFRSNSENDQNARLVETIRQRLRRRNETICELQKKIHKLEMDKNELSTNLETEAAYSGRNSDILKEVADLLCELRGKQFSYIGLYNTCPSQMNPFCEAIMEMQKDFKAKEAQLLQDLKVRNREIEELAQMLLKSEKNFNQERALSSDSDKAQLSCTPPSPPPPPPSQLSPTLATSVTKPSPTSSTAQQSDNIPTTTLETVLVEKTTYLKDTFF